MSVTVARLLQKFWSTVDATYTVHFDILYALYLDLDLKAGTHA